jgi:hypothetical protein
LGWLGRHSSKNWWKGHQTDYQADHRKKKFTLYYQSLKLRELGSNIKPRQFGVAFLKQIGQVFSHAGQVLVRIGNSLKHVFKTVGLVIAGDAAYNDVHLYLVESNSKSRQEWISALDKIESLNPRTVIAAHKRPGNDDNPSIIEETRQYICDFHRIAEMTATAQELYDKMLELYPNRVNPGTQI